MTATSMEKRLAALETLQSGGKRTARQMTTEELESIVSPLFDGRVPTHDELQELVDRRKREVDHGNA